jgi:hypothetical protein
LTVIVEPDTAFARALDAFQRVGGGAGLGVRV